MFSNINVYSKVIGEIENGIIVLGYFMPWGLAITFIVHSYLHF